MNDIWKKEECITRSRMFGDTPLMLKWIQEMWADAEGDEARKYQLGEISIQLECMHDLIQSMAHHLRLDVVQD